MEMTLVVSEALRAVGYDPETRVMRVAFKSGAVYDYLDVEAELFEEMLLPHPWRLLAPEVLGHRYRRL